MVSALAAVRAAIARAVLGDTDDAAVTLGAITLRPHQRDALRRVRASIESAGGALLADDPGLGKTFVALALARDFPAAIIVAPAALRSMWREAAAAAGVNAPFVSLESLSRRDATVDVRGALVIVDEAHHVSNPGAARYSRLAKLAAYHRVLLLSATPVRNRRSELSALLALFMGPRAFALADAARAQCIVRRSGDASLLPAIDGPHWHRVSSIPRLRALISRLPPPLPALDGREASALLMMTLARCWASSLAALDTALRRRLQRGATLRETLDAGRLPTRDELRAWTMGDDAVQLAFPMFAVHEAPDADRLRAVLDVHLGAVIALRAHVRPRVARDTTARAEILVALRRAHSGARIIAFTSHAATAEALYGALRRERGVALLTARGARTAGGSRPRADVIDALSGVARARAHDDISLVLATDLLSEGVNLQGASVVVHLDQPWTPSGLDQRVGRAVRMGSAHVRVHVHGIAPPPGAERIIALQHRMTKKRSEQIEAHRPAHEWEVLRAAVRDWNTTQFDGVRNSVRVAVQNNVQNAEGRGTRIRRPLVASVRAARSGFIATVDVQNATSLLCGVPGAGGRWRVSDSPGLIAQLVNAVQSRSMKSDGRFESAARAAIDRWKAARYARESIGNAADGSRGRRLLLARLDAAIRSASVHTRAPLAGRLVRVRALVDQAISAGAERILDDLARGDTPTLESLLAACEAKLSATATRATPATNRAPGITHALLLLRRHP